MKCCRDSLDFGTKVSCTSNFIPLLNTTLAKAVQSSTCKNYPNVYCTTHTLFGSKCGRIVQVGNVQIPETKTHTYKKLWITNEWKLLRKLFLIIGCNQSPLLFISLSNWWIDFDLNFHYWILIYFIIIMHNQHEILLTKLCNIVMKTD